MLLVVAPALGLLVGLVLGLTGAGGSIFAVPLLMWGLGWSLPQAVPVALIAVCIAAGFGTAVAWDVSMVRYRAAMLMAAVSWLFAPLGLRVAGQLPAMWLTLAFATVLVVVSIRMLRQSVANPREAQIVRADVSRHLVHRDKATGRFEWTAAAFAVISAIGASAGFLAGLLGVGGGFVIVPALRATTDLSMHSAIATSLMAIALISAGTVTAALLQGHAMPWRIALPFVAGALVGMLAGRRLAPRIAGPRLQQTFALAMLLVAVALALPYLGTLT
jgi:uncharacterized membrane protein YfcA